MGLMSNTGGHLHHGDTETRRETRAKLFGGIRGEPHPFDSETCLVFSVSLCLRGGFKLTTINRRIILAG